MGDGRVIARINKNLSRPNNKKTICQKRHTLRVVVSNPTHACDEIG
jgi:hypothetical protein